MGYHGERDTGRDSDKPLGLVAVRYEHRGNELVCADCTNWEDDYYEDWCLYEAPKPIEKCARCGKEIR
jgi:hypothetical protein